MLIDLTLDCYNYYGKEKMTIVNVERINGRRKKLISFNEETIALGAKSLQVKYFKIKR